MIFLGDMLTRRLLVSIFLVACGGEGTMGPVDDVPCDEPGEVWFSGTVDGLPVEGNLVARSFVFENAFGGGTTGRLEVVFSADGADRLFLEFSTNIDDGETSAARGFIDLSGQGGVSAGNCDIEGFYSTIGLNAAPDADAGTPLPPGGTFTLRGLRAEPFCTGRDLTGTITGCFSNPAP